jgi:hypothetical protein
MNYSDCRGPQLIIAPHLSQFPVGCIVGWWYLCSWNYCTPSLPDVHSSSWSCTVLSKTFREKLLMLKQNKEDGVFHHLWASSMIKAVCDKSQHNSSSNLIGRDVCDGIQMCHDETKPDSIWYRDTMSFISWVVNSKYPLVLNLLEVGDASHVLHLSFLIIINYSHPWLVTGAPSYA